MDQLRLIAGVMDELEDNRGVTPGRPKLLGEQLRLRARGPCAHVHLGQLTIDKGVAWGHAFTVFATNEGLAEVLFGDGGRCKVAACRRSERVRRIPTCFICILADYPEIV